MNVKEAVAKARSYFQEVFANDGGERATLEEVWFEPLQHRWYVTFGLPRRNTSSILDPSGLLTITNFKVVELSDPDGQVLSVKVRKLEPTSNA